MVTAEEEFGIAAVESLASGRPVIALRSGGVLETVIAGRTGVFYDDGEDPRALAAAVAAFDPGAVDPADVRRRRRGGSASSASRSGCARSWTETVAAERAPRDAGTPDREVYFPAEVHVRRRNP